MQNLKTIFNINKDQPLSQTFPNPNHSYKYTQKRWNDNKYEILFENIYIYFIIYFKYFLYKIFLHYILEY